MKDLNQYVCAKIKGLFSLLDRTAWFPALLTRLVVGLVFIESGWGKLQHLPRVIEFFQSLGIPAPQLQAPFVAATEISCGFMILVGLGSRFASIPLSVTMVVALMTAKRADISGFSDLFQTSEFLYIVLLSWILMLGPGAVSFDRLIKRAAQA